MGILNGDYKQGYQMGILNWGFLNDDFLNGYFKSGF